MQNHTKIVTALAAALSLGAANGAGAQQAAGSTPWRAWLGCWSAGGVTPLGADPSAPLVCVTPTENPNAVRIATIVDGKVASTQAVDASGREMPLEAKGCTGTQTGRWSADGRRVYLNAAATCDGTLRTTSGILAITADGDWLDVQGTNVGGTENVRVARYHDVGMRTGVPAEIAESLRDINFSVAGAQVLAGADIGTTAVVEAAKATTVGVTEAFVLERGQRFSLDAQQLVALADAGVPSRLTDAMIAVSNPQTFAVKRPAPRDTVYNDVSGRRVYVTMDRFGSPWGWGYDPYGYGYGYSPYGYNSLGYGGYGGYGLYGAYGYPGYTYGGPVIIVKGAAAAQPHGRMVKGRGYEQPASSSNAAAERAARAERQSSGGASSGGGRSSGSSGSSSSGDRTAKPRP